MKKIFFCLSLVLSIAACEDSGEREVSKPKSDLSGKPGTGAGPYTVTFSSEDQSYQHSFDIPIHQEEGKVEYQIRLPQNAEVEFVETKLRVKGCLASSVGHEVFWIPNTAVGSVGSYLTEGQMFHVQAGMPGSFVHLIRGLGGCTDISLMTKLRIKSRARLLWSCHSSYERDYTEIEVTQDPAIGTTLRSYLHPLPGHGERRLRKEEAVSASVQGDVFTYVNSTGDLSLIVNRQNLTGVFVEKLFDQMFAQNVICSFP